MQGARLRRRAKKRHVNRGPGGSWHLVRLPLWSLDWRRTWQPTPVFLPGESPRTEEPGGLQSMGSQRVGHNWATNTSWTCCQGSGRLWKATETRSSIEARRQTWLIHSQGADRLSLARLRQMLQFWKPVTSNCLKGTAEQMVWAAQVVVEGQASAK